MERHETGRPTARFPSAVPVLHGDSAVVLLRVLHDADGFGFTGQYACRGGGSDMTSTSRQLMRNLDAFEQTAIVAHYPTINEARAAMQKGEIYGFYYIPKGTTAKAQSQRQPTVSFYTNNTLLIAGSLLYKDMKMMSELASGAAARTSLYAKGATEDQAMAFLQPIVIDTHPLNNPWLNYSVYLCNTFAPGVLMLLIFMITVYSIGVEIKDRTAREWLRMEIIPSISPLQESYCRIRLFSS